MSRKKNGNGHGGNNGVVKETFEPAARFDIASYYKVDLGDHRTQRKAFSLFKSVDYLFLIGPAGVGKSFVAAALGIREVAQNRAHSIVLTRPIVEAEESLGYLPGTFEEKVAPYMRPMYKQFKQIFTEKEVRKQFEKEYVEVWPVAYMRGETFSNSVCILDEAQNANYAQLKLYLTRMGRNSKMIITGDPEQADIRDSGLMDVIKRCKHRKSVGVVEFEPSDNVRHPSVEYMLEDL